MTVDRGSRGGVAVGQRVARLIATSSSDRGCSAVKKSRGAILEKAGPLSPWPGAVPAIGMV